MNALFGVVTCGVRCICDHDDKFLCQCMRREEEEYGVWEKDPVCCCVGSSMCNPSRATGGCDNKLARVLLLLFSEMRSQSERLAGSWTSFWM